MSCFSRGFQLSFVLTTIVSLFVIFFKLHGFASVFGCVQFVLGSGHVGLAERAERRPRDGTILAPKMESGGFFRPFRGMALT